MESLPVDIHNILFRPDDRVEITYAEKREQSDTIAVVRTIVIDQSRFREEVSDLETEAFELVDMALEALRDPPDKEPARR